jgi:hypothetical protein
MDEGRGDIRIPARKTRNLCPVFTIAQNYHQCSSESISNRIDRNEMLTNCSPSPRPSFSWKTGRIVARWTR